MFTKNWLVQQIAVPATMISERMFDWKKKNSFEEKIHYSE